MLVDLLDGRMSTQLLRTRAGQLGIDLGAGLTVALFEGPSDQRPEAWLRHALTTLNGQRDTLVDVVAGTVVAPLAGYDRAKALRWLRGLCVACGGGAGVLGRDTDVDGVPAAYAETRRVLDLVARSEAASRGAPSSTSRTSVCSACSSTPRRAGRWNASGSGGWARCASTTRASAPTSAAR
jgi:hypothetical protein